MSDGIENLPCTLLPYEGVYDKIVEASKYGACSVDGTQMSSFKFFEEIARAPEDYNYGKVAALEASAALIGVTSPLVIVLGPFGPALLVAGAFFGTNRAAVFIVGNATEGDLVQTGLYLNCGLQTGRPAYVETNPITGSQKSSKKDLIPGVDTTSIPGFLQMGAGMYQFEKDLDLGIGVYGTAGAMSFFSTDPEVNTTFGVAWIVPQRGKPKLYVCADLSAYSDLEDFYDKTCEDGKNNSSDSARKGKNKGYIRGSAVPRNYPDDEDYDNMVMTITVKK